MAIGSAISVSLRSDVVDQELAIKTENLTKTYVMDAERVYALQGVDISIRRGEYVAIMGPSGSGKSTLMHVMGLLDVPEEGTYRINNREVSNLQEDE